MEKSNDSLVGSERMNNSTIRDASREDAGLLAWLIRESFRDVAQRFSVTLANCPKHPSHCQTAWVEGDQARGVRFFILAMHGEPAGCAAIERKDEAVSLLRRLAVLPQHRRCGLGRSLVNHVIAQAKAAGSSRLSANIIASHAELNRWYRRLGFVEVDTKAFPHLPFAVTYLEYRIEESANLLL